MRIVRGLESYPPDAAAAAVALGVFDGVHLGHQAILATAVARAREAGLGAVACTFDPHPVEILHPERAPAPITPLDERLERIALTGVHTTVILPFTPALAAVEPEAFIKDILVQGLQAHEIVVGFNHRFGRGARGDARLLEALSRLLGFRAHVVPPLLLDGAPVSSSEIRAALKQGDLARAARYLGRPYSIRGKVERGAGRGRGLGFPTANISPDRPVLVPTGVYVCRSHIGSDQYAAVVNVGVRPTFGEQALIVEAHLLDFTGDLYGEALRLEFLGRLREEQKFSDVAALRRQIALDVARARVEFADVRFT